MRHPSSRFARVLSPASVALAAVLLLSCRDSGGDRERVEGLQLRALLRRDSAENADINVAEYEYAEKAKLSLGILAGLKRDSPNWPTPQQVRDMIKPIMQFEARRRAIERSLTELKLETPLPVAIREDVRELLDERIGLDEGWRIKMESLIRALELNHEQAVRDQTAHLVELFNAYGPLQNSLKLEADSIEEQLRLPWTNDPENRPGWREGKPEVREPAVPSSSQ